MKNESENRKIVIEPQSDCEDAVFQKELHLDKEINPKKKSKNALDFKIQFGVRPSHIGDSIYNSSPRREQNGLITSEDEDK